MTWRVAASAALFLAALGCSGQNQNSSAAPADGSAGTTPAAAATPGGGVEVSGKLAPSLAPGATFITLEPRGDGEMPIKSSPAVMDQVSQVFLPAFLVAQAGQRVDFRNSDDVLHNIRVTESSAAAADFQRRDTTVREIRIHVRTARHLHARMRHSPDHAGRHPGHGHAVHRHDERERQLRHR